MQLRAQKRIHGWAQIDQWQYKQNSEALQRKFSSEVQRKSYWTRMDYKRDLLIYLTNLLKHKDKQRNFTNSVALEKYTGGLAI